MPLTFNHEGVGRVDCDKYRNGDPHSAAPCNLMPKPVVLVIVQRFLKKVPNDCNLGLKAVVIEEQNQTKTIKP
jgi:hypothetical protein